MGTERYVKIAIFGMFKYNQEGDMMDAPKNMTW